MPALNENQKTRLARLIQLIAEETGAGPSYAAHLAAAVIAEDHSLDPDVVAAMRDVAASDEDLRVAAKRFARRANEKMLDDLSKDSETAGMAAGMRSLRAHHDAAPAPTDLPLPAYVLSLDLDKVHVVVMKGPTSREHVDAIARTIRKAGARAVVVNVDADEDVEVVSLTARKVDPS